MKFKTIILVVLIPLVLAACGVNPVEKLEEEAAEQIAETIIEQASDAANVNIEMDGDEVSYTVEDGEGNEYNVSSEVDANVDAIVGMGFNIPMPDGFTNGTVQHVEENGEEVMVSATFEVAGLSAEEVLQGLHDAATAAGFTYMDMAGNGLTQPDANDPLSSTMVNYTHPDGVQFSIMRGDEDVILGLTKFEDGSMGEGAGETAVTNQTAILDTTLDGSMTLAKDSFTVGEAIEISLVINSVVADDAWVGIIPAAVPHGLEAEADAADVSYLYTRDAVDGKLILYAPLEAGNYDVRLFNTDGEGGVELESVPFMVSE